MTTNAQHTPWKVIETTRRGTYGQPTKGCPTGLTIVPADVSVQSQVIAYLAIRANGDNLEQAKAYAALIVQAVNAHADLVALLGQAQAQASLAKAQGHSFLSDNWIEKARAALAKAKVE